MVRTRFRYAVSICVLSMGFVICGIPTGLAAAETGDTSGSSASGSTSSGGASSTGGASSGTGSSSQSATTHTGETTGTGTGTGSGTGSGTKGTTATGQTDKAAASETTVTAPVAVHSSVDTSATTAPDTGSSAHVDTVVATEQTTTGTQASAVSAAPAPAAAPVATLQATAPTTGGDSTVVLNPVLPSVDNTADSTASTTSTSTTETASSSNGGSSGSGHPTSTNDTVAHSATEAVGAVADAVGNTVATVLSAAVSETPVTDVVTAVQTTLTATVAPVAPAPLFGPLMIPWLPGEIAASGRLSTGGAMLYPALAAPVWMPSAGGYSPRPGMPDDLVNTSTLLLERSRTAGPQPGEMSQATDTDTRSLATSLSQLPIFQASALHKAITGVLVSVSLWALLSAALPGLGGLAVVGAAGVRVGYRQAKGGFMVRTSGSARFAGPGPLGVVRSGSFIELRSRPLRKRGPQTRQRTDESVATVTVLERAA